ncbi:MAG TPA: ATP-binding protein [Candidatus Acidoferrales bacterium]|nr:ATP-binding protein [Candidatus Acidoferrales bacterium]
MTRNKWVRNLWLALGILAVSMLAAAVFTLGSLNTPVQPENGNDFAVFFALSTFIGIAFLVFLLILTRSLLRVLAEHRAGQLGSRFKTKMVLGAMGVSLLPVVFLFFFSYALVNRTMNIWFPRPLEIANEQSKQLVSEFGKLERERLDESARQVVDWLKGPGKNRSLKTFRIPGGSEIELLWTLSPQGKVVGSEPKMPAEVRFQRTTNPLTDAEMWQVGSKTCLIGKAPYHGGWLMVGRAAPANYLARLSEIESQMATYEAQRQRLRYYKNEILLGLLLITLLLLFAATWVALFLSKRVTVPIQALAKATQQVAHGNLDYRITTKAHDELGALVDSFNRMAGQLGESRRQIQQFTNSLQQAVEEIERRRKLMETILENIPTGVLSLDSNGAVTRVNAAGAAMFGEKSAGAQSLSELLGQDATAEIQQLMRRSSRMGVATQEMEFTSGGRLLHAAVTVSSLGAGQVNSGFVVVIDDVTDVLRAQKAAAWQEVAQRIAHEIKNPLTPIQLSAQRLLRHLSRSAPARRREDRTEWPQLVAECAGLIEREVQTLESLVEEFSQFARFPAARLAVTDVNSVVATALQVFSGRLDGISLRQELAPDLPMIRADAELLRRVIVNLIDNAAEALEGAKLQTITVTTRAAGSGDAIEIRVSDTGHGISPEDKDKLFFPHFSTKERGTGLGLAIANRIVGEHHGALTVCDNQPSGAAFVVRLPAAEVPSPTPSAQD